MGEDSSDVSLCCFPATNRFRIAARRFVLSSEVDSFIIGVIMISSICLAMDSPRLDPTSSLAGVLSALDLVWTAIFALECSLKAMLPHPSLPMPLLPA